jgi:hypothetical protein
MGEGLRPVPHLYDNATAIDGSRCFAPVPSRLVMRTPRARARPGSKLWPSTTGEGLRPVPHLYDNVRGHRREQMLRTCPLSGNNEYSQGEGSPWEYYYFLERLCGSHSKGFIGESCFRTS